MGGGRRQRHTGGAHEAGQDNCEAQHTILGHQIRSLKRRIMAARSSGMPSPVRDDVTSTSGNAAGCFTSAALVAVMVFSSSDFFT